MSIPDNLKEAEDHLQSERYRAIFLSGELTGREYLGSELFKQEPIQDFDAVIRRSAANHNTPIYGISGAYFPNKNNDSWIMTAEKQFDKPTDYSSLNYIINLALTGRTTYNRNIRRSW